MSDTDNGASGESATRSRTPNNNNQTAGNNSGATSTARGWDAMVEHITSNKIDSILAVTRALTVLCTISYLVGFPGPSENRFKQALLMNAATSSLRLHQRMPPPSLNQLSRTYFTNLIREDSFHYLIYPFLFVTGYPILLALLPCSLYAIFNLARYSITILDKLGDREQLKIKISSFITHYQQSLLHTVALAEVTLLPVLVLGVLTRYVGPLVPVLYYRFLMLRYNSTRNSHMKLLVSQIMAMASAQWSRLRR